MRRTKRAFGGFTLIEILVVIVIIGILASLVAVGVNVAFRTAKINMTEARVETLAGAAEQYRTRHGAYPPSTLEDLRARIPNDTNTGIECLVACLASKKSGGVLHAPSDEEYANADEDKVDKNVTDWYFGDNALREYVDAFGYVLTYVHHQDYAKPRPTLLKYKFVKGGPTQTITVEKSGVTKAFSAPTRFQIRSPGLDGQWGTEDDIRGRE